MFSKACEYAIRASIYIAGESLQGNKVGQKAIAKAIDGPEAFTAKTLQKLTKGEVVSADKGPNGGFYFTNEQLKNITLRDIVDAIDGNALFVECGLGLHKCNDKKPCPVHFQFKAIRDGLTTLLASNSVQTMAMEMKNGETFLKR